MLATGGKASDRHFKGACVLEDRKRNQSESAERSKEDMIPFLASEDQRDGVENSSL